MGPRLNLLKFKFMVHMYKHTTSTTLAIHNFLLLEIEYYTYRLGKVNSPCLRR